MMLRSQRARAGFTLVEMIVSIVILGILAGIVAIFIRAPILGYRDSVDRAEITDQADLSLRRIARDIRLALPNSVRVSADGSALELLQTRSGGRYLSTDDDSDGSLAPYVLNFDDPNQRTFTAFAALGSFGQVRAGDYVVVYNLGPGFDQADAYNVPASGAAGNIAAIKSLATTSASGLANAIDIELTSNPFGRQQPAMPSPAYRFQVVSGPVSFMCLTAGDGTAQLWRVWNYPIAPSQPMAVPGTAQKALVASRLMGCTNLFNYSTAANQRTGLVGIALELHGRNDNAAAIRLVHQVHVDNTP
jgi:MSHA biogenesis protein MshO